MIVFFDIEVYPNYFLALFKNSKGIFYSFEIYNDKIIGNKTKVNTLLHKAMIVGYNSSKYDIPVLKFALDKPKNIDIFKYSSNIIDKKNSYFTVTPTNSIDLMSLLFNVNAKSLKLMACSIKYPKIQELPIEVGKIVNDSEVETLKLYCQNDVNITEALYKTDVVQKALKLRKEIYDEFGVLCFQSPSVVGNKLLEKWYFEDTEDDSFKNKKTLYQSLTLKEAGIERFKYKTSKIRNFINEIKDLKVSVFDNKGKRLKKESEKIPDINIFGLRLQFGAGGIHSKDKPKRFVETDEYEIIDWDVDSLYPTIAINLNAFPKHLKKVFKERVVSMRNERLNLKKQGLGKSTKSETFKLILNSLVGKYGSEYSFLCDALQNLRVTTFGQFAMLFLIETLALNGFKIISANTDGITMLIKRNRKKLLEALIDDFCLTYNLSGEYTYYKKYIRKDVNNYIAIQTNDKIKTKGIFTPEIDITKGYVFPIISIALYEYYVNNIDIKDTILNHKDIYDFCMAQKIGSQFKVFYNNQEISKVNRFYVSNTGYPLIKVKKRINKNNEEVDSENNIIKDVNVKLFNDYTNEKSRDINYDFYINLTNKIIEKINEN